MANRSSISKKTMIPLSQTFFNIRFNMENMTEEEILMNLEFFSNITNEMQEYDILDDKKWRVFIIMLYAIVIILGFLGNFLVVFVIMRNKHLHSVTNIFIANLAVSDMALCIFNAPFQLYYQLNHHWIFGEVLCRIIMPTFAVPFYASSMSILMIAIDRYILIVYPFRSRITKLMSFVILFGITLLALGFAVPLIVYTRIQMHDIPLLNFYKVVCMESWPSHQSRRVYTVSLFAIQFFIPLLSTAIIYTRIYCVLKNRPLKKSDTRRNRKTNRILVAIVALFTTCWLPYSTLGIIAEFNTNAVRGKYFTFIDLLLKIFAMSSACINPLMYGWLNDNFRKEFGNIFGKGSGRRDARTSRSIGATSQVSRTYTECPNNTLMMDRLTTNGTAL